MIERKSFHCLWGPCFDLRPRAFFNQVWQVPAQNLAHICSSSGWQWACNVVVPPHEMLQSPDPDTSSVPLKALCLHFLTPLPKPALWEGGGVYLTSKGTSSAWLGPAAHPWLWDAAGSRGASRAVSHSSRAAYACGECASSSCRQPTGGTSIPCHHLPESAASNLLLPAPGRRG